MSHSLQMAHGGGGRLSRELIEAEILPRFGQGPLQGLPDAASLELPSNRVAYSTDSFVVKPVEFPGGNIGTLAVHGTANDLAVCGAEPRWMSLALILEEGLSLDLLRRILDTIRDTANAGNIQVVTGDLKVVGRGQCDALYVNTSGIGVIQPAFALAPSHVQPGDMLLVSGPVGDHGMAVLAAREHLDFTHGPVSDTGPIYPLVRAALPWAPAIRFMRDPTRGGVAAVLNEIASGLPVDLQVDESAIPIDRRTAAVAELLGIDILQVACEGRVLAICAAGAAQHVLDAWQGCPEGRQSALIGTVTPGTGRVLLKTRTGGTRLLDIPAGELLPRIC
ncbi:MAG: hydrogenase expression/formation protein HypE [Lentisphaerae bacterium RIFOXYC12_FULL_60_16]|nr:MAG: hydrogenase expression/formation protein HypE [Lentisphaerae bacterium RIFOXYC12_FULL_60_16]OGV73716.1 MAG: hydrogenase expression/formation protein HypE [Lentisphaerae bacterium RIFOXYA12_FULL_60_10]OGV79340.1 MAG: hydrogenase expression/formation protein HypE [Lentisphaerae bacterium RIFOXYB12_FULL_60_10]